MKTSHFEIVKFMVNNRKYHLDFLKYQNLSDYYQNDNYYFYKVQMFGLKEIRLNKKSFRVTVSKKFTSIQ